MRQDNTKKVIGNFILENEPLCQLIPHAGSDKAWLWMAHDYSDGEMKRSKFALRFGTPEITQEFKKAFEDATVYNHCIRTGAEATPAPVIEEAKSE